MPIPIRIPLLLSVGLTLCVARAAAADPPDAPSYLEARADSAPQIQLSWSSSSGAQSYVVLRDTDSGGYSYRELGDTSGTSYTDRDVKAGMTYYYVVKAKGASSSDVSKASNQAHVALAPPAPRDLEAKIESSYVSLRWSSESTASSYSVLRGTDEYSMREIGTTSSTWYQDSDVHAGETYVYAVKAKTSGDVKSEKSNKAKIAMPLETPRDLEASASSSSTIQLHWDSVSHASDYIIERDTDSGGYSYREVSTTSSTSFSDSGLEPGKTYYYVVVAKTNAAKSPRSNQAHASTPSN